MRPRIVLFAVVAALVAACSSATPTTPTELKASFDGVPSDTTSKGPVGSGSGG
jgi:hypothetical protein